MRKGMTVLRSPQRKLMPDIAGSEKHEPTSLRGIAKKVELFFCAKRAMLKSAARKNHTPGTERGCRVTGSSTSMSINKTEPTRALEQCRN